MQREVCCGLLASVRSTASRLREAEVACAVFEGARFERAATHHHPACRALAAARLAPKRFAAQVETTFVGPGAAAGRAPRCAWPKPARSWGLVRVSSGTVALSIAAQVLGLKPGDEVCLFRLMARTSRHQCLRCAIVPQARGLLKSSAPPGASIREHLSEAMTREHQSGGLCRFLRQHRPRSR